jgi:hypothetical protein
MFAQSLEANDCGEPWAICVLGSDADVEEEINRMLLNRRDAFNHLEKRKQYLNILRHFEAQLFSMRVPTLYFSRRWAERLLSHAYYLFNEGNMVEHRPKVAPAERKIAGLCMLVPGLGPVAAKTLIDKFGTIAALADACRDDELAEGLAVKFLAQLDGIGPIRAKRIADALTKGATK